MGEGVASEVLLPQKGGAEKVLAITKRGAGGFTRLLVLTLSIGGGRGAK